MFVLVRAVTYAALFVALVLLYVPVRLLSWFGFVRPEVEVPQVVGMVVAAVGAAIALSGASSHSHLSDGALRRPLTHLADW